MDVRVDQNPLNKQEVFYGEKLKPVLGDKDKVGFLEIAMLLSKHFPLASKPPEALKEPKVPKSRKASKVSDAPST